MDLCDFCGQPKCIHMGFDHGALRCLLAAGSLGLSLRYYGDHKKARAVVAEVNAWREAQERIDDGQRWAGSGI